MYYTGKQFIFEAQSNTLLFSSSKENIGKIWDVVVMNGTIVNALNEPITIITEKYGGITVIEASWIEDGDYKKAYIKADLLREV